MAVRRVRERQKHALEVQGGSRNMISRPCWFLEVTTPLKLESWAARSRHPLDIHHF